MPTPPCFSDAESSKIPNDVLRAKRLEEIKKFEKLTNVSSLLKTIEDDKVNIQEEEKNKVPEGQPDTDLILKLPDEENIQVESEARASVRAELQHKLRAFLYGPKSCHYRMIPQILTYPRKIIYNINT